MNKLDNIKEFKHLISDYSPSTESLDILKQVQLTLLVAPSSAGRNTVIRELVKEGDFSFIVTDTTRTPRINNGVLEVNGTEYWFKNEDQFLTGLKHGDYLEAELIHEQQVSGISIKELSKTIDDSKIAITDVDIGGVEAIIKHKPDVKIIMLLPPSFNEWLKRLRERGEMSKEEIRRRLTTAVNIFNAGLEEKYFNFVISKDVQKSAAIIRNISKSKEPINSINNEAYTLIKELLIDTKNYLNKNN